MKTKNRWKRWLVTLLTVTMVTGQFPTIVQAEEQQSIEQVTIEEEEVSEGTATEDDSIEEAVDQTLISEGTGGKETQAESVSTGEIAPVSDEEDKTIQEELQTSDETEQQVDALVEEQQQPAQFAAVAGSGYCTLDEAVNKGSYLLTSGEEIIVTGAEGLILLSHVDPSDYYDKTISLKLVNNNTDLYDLRKTLTLDSTDYSFQGLGNSDYPFQKELKYETGSEKDWLTTVPVFNVLSPQATLPQMSFRLISEDHNATDNTDTDQPLLAALVQGTTSTKLWQISLTKFAAEDTGTPQIGGLIGNIGDGSAYLEVKLETGVKCQAGSESVGLLCHTMENATLTTTLYYGENVSVNVGNVGTVGGLVGTAKSSAIQLNGGFIGTVTSSDGSAGGLVGSMTDTTITVLDSFTISATINASAGGKFAGGIAGRYVNSDTVTMDLSKVMEYSVTISGNSSNGTSGGLFGDVQNSGSLTIKGNAETKRTVNSSSNAGTIGGLIGTYQATALANSLVIQNMSPSSKRTGGDSYYGGVIGTVNSVCYIEMDGINASVYGVDKTFGGLIAQVNGTVMLNAKDITVGNTPNVTVDGQKRAGLIGYLKAGVVRLSGTTDLSGLIIKPGRDCGKIVGQNYDGLVYAVSGWSYSNYPSSTASNIGNWSDVIRLDTEMLQEGESGLLSFNNSEHTVTVNNMTGTNATYELNSKKDFAAYALAFNYSENDVLKFCEDVDPTQSQIVTLSCDVDLQSTGILGIGRDNGSDGEGNEFPAFRGSFDGKGYKITLDTGGGTNPLWAYQISGVNNQHGRLGLFASVSGESVIKNITVNGTVNMSVLNGISGNDKQKKANPLRVAGVAAYQTGTVKYENVTSQVQSTVSGTGDNNNNAYVAQAGFVAHCGDDSTLVFANCNWKSPEDSGLSNTRAKDENYVGGFLGYADTLTLTVTDCQLSGKIALPNVTVNAHVGGLVADLSDSTVQISNLSVTGESITTAASNSGGLLGYRWQMTNVTFGKNSNETTPASTGVSISGCSLTTQGKFGGLVYCATGYWNATKAGSICFSGNESNTNSVIGKTADNNTSALLVADGVLVVDSNDASKTQGLYLEIGTWGTDPGKALSVATGSISLKLNENVVTESSTDCFDELVGWTIKDIDGNCNGVVSLATNEHELIDDTECNTYNTLLRANFKNGNTRYYYNLDSYRQAGQNDLSEVDASALDLADKVLSWSVSQFAATNIRQYFCKNASDPAVIRGNTNKINFTGYSYYPVSPLANISSTGEEGAKIEITFAYDKIETKEENNKQPSDNKHEHYLMHCGLLYNVNHDLTVSDTSFAGVVGKTADGSGALACGTVSGNSATNQITTVSLNGVTLNGIIVSPVDSYAPLLINKIDSYVTLNVMELSTGEGYIKNDNTTFAATSLIGRVGSSSAGKINLQFSNIALDARKNTQTTTSVTNNGKKNQTVDYKTFRTIFTRATLLESFQYASESNGRYNFNNDDLMVTYGVEISNTKSGRNRTKQYTYYNSSDYVWDGVSEQPTANTIGTYYSSSAYLRYVAEPETTDEKNYRELDINIRPVNLDKGCGTYGDPYQITDGNQFVALADFLSNGTATDWVVNINTEAINSTMKEFDYHTATTGSSEKDSKYICFETTWYSAEESDGIYSKGDSVDNSNISTANIQKYLRNAYYQIQNDITIDNTGFSGIGGKNITIDTFSGVIIGKKENDKCPTVKILIEKSGVSTFGGLIQYSQGSVVKDLVIDYSEASITMENTALTGSSNNPFFGGVVGYCMGGDTIIDNVSVTYGENSVKLSDSTGNGYDRLIATGGYVGLVGGSRNVTESSDYEKTGGGVVFRNMNNHSNNFSNALVYAEQEAPQLKSDGTSAEGGCTYFFCNCYVGRVMDGYACYENPSGTAGSSTLNNTDKNYTIPDVVGDSGLTVDANYNVSVTSAQGLWLLSAIVNSGAGAMKSNGIYQDVDSKKVEAYQYGKPRSGEYNKIGQDGGDSDLADETFWGGVESSTSNDTAKAKARMRVSYLVKKYTTATNDIYYAARLTGDSGNGSNVVVSLSFGTQELDMTAYGNGFRGIGGSYGQKNKGKTSEPDKVQRRSLRVSGVTGYTSGTTITLAMNQYDYESEFEGEIWSNQGAGLFTVFMYQAGTNGTCYVKNLTISGVVSVRTYSFDSKENIFKEVGIKKINYDMGVGGFASRPAKSQDQSLKFDNFHLNNLKIIGGTSSGGAIGLVECCGAIEFDNWSIKESTVYKWVYHDGSTGGLVGWHHSNKALTIKGYLPANGFTDNVALNINNLTVKVKADSKQYCNAGGLAGANDESGSKIIFKNIYVDTLKVSGYNARDIGGLADGGQGITISNCLLKNLTVTDDGNSGPVGGLIGTSKAAITIEQVKISGESAVNGKASYAGGMIGRQDNTGQVIIKHSQIIGESGKPILVKSENQIAGGFLGYPKSNNVIQNCTAEYLQVQAPSSDAGGLVGKMENGSTSVSDMVFSNVTVVAKNKDSKSAGLLVGNTQDKPVYGYNILADNCSIFADTNTPPQRAGIWMGYCNANCTLVAVAIKGTVQPKKDVGTINNGKTVKITYADYPLDQVNEPDSTSVPNSASPWLDVNPIGDIEVKENSSSDSFTLTGNAVGKKIVTSTDENGSEVTTNQFYAKVILEESNPTAVDKKYYNLTDYTDLLKTENPVYLCDYHEEESSGTEVPTEKKFPVLVINTNINSELNKYVWNFIAAMTNVSSGEKAQEQVTAIDIKTYKWVADAEAFVKQANSSLSYNSATKTIRSTGRFDNTLSQITVLDVQYDDPTSSVESDVFHLYIPVLVKKLMNVKANVVVLEGTNYYPGDYLSMLGKKEYYSTAGFDEPVTAYIEYNYNRTKEDWQTSLDNGENLLWSYKKLINLLGDGKKKLPVDTRLTLLDKQNGEVYTHTIRDTDEQSKFLFSTFPGFQQQPICDLLAITLAESADETKTLYVEESNSSNATVKVGDVYYRPAEETDTEKTKYALTVGNVVTASGYLSEGEVYYLTIQVPKTDEVSVINNLMQYPSTTTRFESDGLAPPTIIAERNGGRYILYGGVKQNGVSIETMKMRDGTVYPDEVVMVNQDSIRVTLQATLQLNGEEEDKKLFGVTYPPNGMYQQFVIDLRKFNQSNSATPVSIGAQSVTWHYEIYKVDADNNREQIVKTDSETSDDCKGEDRLSFTYSDDLPSKIYEASTTNKSIVIVLVADLYYDDVVEQGFPQKVSTDDQYSGISVFAQSSIAYRESLLQVTNNRLSCDASTKRYITDEMSMAVLSYNTKTIEEGTGSGDSNAQLGINASDPERNLLSINTVGRYDYSNVSQDLLDQATGIRYTVELYQKQADRTYSGDPLKLGTYWSAFSMDNLSVNGWMESTSYEITNTDFQPQDSRVCYIPIEFSVITGDEFEAAGLTYANYKVKLTVVLMNSEGPMTMTEATDYIIYTNARIHQQIFE